MSMTEAARRIRTKYPFALIRNIAGQPDPRQLSIKRYGHFGRLPHGGGCNEWRFETEQARKNFIETYGGEIVP